MINACSSYWVGGPGSELDPDADRVDAAHDAGDGTRAGAVGLGDGLVVGHVAVRAVVAVRDRVGGGRIGKRENAAFDAHRNVAGCAARVVDGFLCDADRTFAGGGRTGFGVAGGRKHGD